MSEVLVLGIGGAGCQLASKLHERLEVRAVAVNTDPEGLKHCGLQEQVLLDARAVTPGFQGNCAVRENAAEVVREAFMALVDEAEILVVTAGMGGVVGTQVAPFVVEYARARNMPVIAAVTLPFGFEGERRRELAMAGLSRLTRSADEMVVLDHAEEYKRAAKGSLADYFEAVAETVAEQVGYRLHLLQ